MANVRSRSWTGWAVGGVLAVLLLALAAFQSRERDDPARATTVTIAGIAYPYQGSQAYNGLTGVVIRQGWLKDQLARRGIALAFTPVPTAVGGPMINEGFASKRIDFAAYGDFPAIIAGAGGVPLKLVAPVGQGQNTYLIVRNGLSASDIRALKGKRIALHRGRPWELPFSKLLDANGLKLSDFTIVNINPAATPAALASGSVDAAVLLSDALLAEEKGQGRIIWSTRQAPPDWRMRAELFARADFVAGNPEVTQLVVDAYVRAAAWSAQDSNRATVTRDAARGALPEQIVAKDYAGDAFSWRERFSPLFTRAMTDHYRAVADYTHARGLVRRKVDVDDLLDSRFVDRALRDLHLEGFWTSAPAPVKS